MFMLRTSFLIEKCNIRKIRLIIIIFSTEISLIFHIVPKFQKIENRSTPKRTILQGRRNRPVKSFSEFEFWSVSNHLQKFFSTKRFWGLKKVSCDSILQYDSYRVFSFPVVSSGLAHFKNFTSGFCPKLLASFSFQAFLKGHSTVH